MQRMMRRFLALLSLACAGATGGCLLAAGAAGGSGIYFTSRGAEAVVQGTVSDVSSTTLVAFRNLGIQHKGQKNTDDGKQMYGVAGDNDVTVNLKRETDHATRVEVKVRKSSVTWDKAMARRTLEEINSLRG